jgi:hypothetical protein
MNRHPNARSSQLSKGDENLSGAMKFAAGGPNKGKPQGDMATAGNKGPAGEKGGTVAKWSPGKVSNTGNKAKS